MDAFTNFWSVLVGLVVVAVIVRSVKRAIDLQKHGRLASGVVVRNKLSWWGRGIIVRPVVRFTTDSGQVIEAVDYSGWASTLPRFKSGEKVRIRYNEKNPRQFERR